MTTTNYYLPAGTRIIIRDAKGETRPYTTKDDVPVTGAKDTTCPRRNIDVKTVAYKGYDLFFMEEQVRLHLNADEKAKVKNIRIYKLDYDIPDNVVLTNEDGTRLSHPSQWLWNYAVRVSKSTWCVPADRMNALLVRLNRLTELGCVWNPDLIDVSENEKIFGQCVRGIQRELAKRMEGFEQSQIDAETKLNELPADATEKDREKARKALLKSADAIQKRYEELVKLLTAGANVFGINQNYINFAAAQNTASQIRLGMRERAKRFAEAVAAIRATGLSDANAVANAMESGEMDPTIAADYVQENVDVAQGEALREVFSLVGADEDTAE